MPSLPIRRRMPLASGAFLLLLLFTPALLARAAVQSTNAPASTAATISPAAAISLEIPQSVFAIPASPKEGRDPFFPHSVLRVQTPESASRPESVDPSKIVLNGLTSPPRPTAIINGSTFAPGEKGSVKLPNGARVLVQCLEIRSNTVMVMVSGQVRELRLRRDLY